MGKNQQDDRTRSGSHEKHVKAGQQSHKQSSSQQKGQDQQEQQSGIRGGTPQQHVEAGRQSHKNS